MSGDNKRISLKVDLINGIIEIDAPTESFDQAIAKTKELTDGLDLGRRKELPLQAGTADAVAQPQPTMGTDKPIQRSKQSAKAAPSGARPGRIGSFTPDRELLSEEQQIILRDFVSQKAPSDQSEQIQVAIFKGEDLLARQGFNFNEVYTLLWRAGIDPLPKALDVIIQRLVQEQRVEKNDRGYFLKFLGRNFVEKDLPRPKAIAS